ncbi:inositol monophosphatase [Candidatus Uhrbacteria bacterium]|nr:inositol monophosphatase [Candidatus Uhrbacteria bacterium]
MSIDQMEVEKVIRGVREMLLPHYYADIAFTSKSEQAHDLVTELDVAVEEYLRSELGKPYPEVFFVGEETGGDRNATRKWLCDPIDGTVHFIRGNPFCTTMLALIEDGQVNMSFIYDFVGDVMYHAVRGQGAYRNGEPIHVSTRALKGSYMGWETHVSKEENLKIHMDLWSKSAFFKSICAGMEFAMVAMGKLEGRICFDPYGKDYDFAAGSLLVSEAGGVVANIGSSRYDYANLDFIAANPIVYKELTEGPEAIFPLT